MRTRRAADSSVGISGRVGMSWRADTIRRVVMVASVLLARSSALDAQVARQIGGIGITLYTAANFSGETATLRSDTPDLRSARMDSRISSLIVTPGEFWEGCDQVGYRGRCQVFSGQERNLAGTGWNDRLMSLHRVRGGGPPPPPPRPVPLPIVGPGQAAVILYDQPNFRGEARRFNGPVPDLAPLRFNDRARSARVTGVWQLCLNAGYNHCAQVSSDFPTLGRIGLAGISSLRPVAVVPPRPPPPLPGRRLVLYGMPDFTGQALDVTGGASWLGGGRSPLSAVARGGSWMVCEGRAFTGRCARITGRMRDLRVLGLGAISSVRPEP